MSLPNSWLSKILALFLFVFLTGTFFASSAHAQSYDSSSYNSDVVLTGHTKAQATLIELSAALICQLIGQDVINPERGCLGIDPITNKIGYLRQDNQSDQIGGMLGLTSNMISSAYIRPVTTMSYVAYLGKNFGIGPKTYAQTEATGFNSLESLQAIWVSMRNISYLAFTILFIAIGIAIMLRVKIDPRTVMSIQNQIPRAIIAILLITFSYSIVGVMIDLMWVTTYAGINILTPNEITDENKSLREVVTEDLINNPVVFVNTIFTKQATLTGNDPNGLTGLSLDVGRTIGDVISRTLSSLFGLDIQTGDCKWWNPTTYESCAENTVRGAIKYFVAILAFLIVIAAILIALVRVWFMLIQALVYIIIYTIVAPLIIIAGLIPGSSLGFGRWFRAVLAHLLVFPVIVFVFLLARILSSNDALNDPSNGSFFPPLVANPNSFDNFGNLIAFGLILVSPQMLTWVREAVKAKPGPVGAAVAKGFGAGVAPGLAGPRFAWKKGWQKADPEKYQSAGWMRRMLYGGAKTVDAGPIRRRIIRPLMGSDKLNQKA